MKKESVVKLGLKLALLGIVALLSNQTPVFAGGTVATCDEASLRAALAGGGSVTFAASGTIVLTNTLVITNNTSIDAIEQVVAISGSHAVRIFTVNPGVSLTLTHLALTDGLARGTNGLDGGPGQGGAVYINNGNLLATDCLFGGNTALGGDVTTNLPYPRMGGAGQESCPRGRTHSRTQPPPPAYRPDRSRPP